MNKKISSSLFFSQTKGGIGLLLVSASGLCFEINLTRIFSVSQFYHFAFMVVSMALLGYGVSGTYLAIKKQKNPNEIQDNLPLLAACSGACMLGSFVLVNTLPFDSFSMVVDPSQILILLLHYAALSSPFFFSGMIISLMLRRYRTSSGKVYAINLVGSAGGCILAIFTPSLLDGEGVVALSAGLASIAAVLFMISEKRDIKKANGKSIASLTIIILTLPLALIPISIRLLTGKMPSYFELNISPYKSISYALQNPQATVISSQWNSISRVDVVSSSSLHSLPGLSYRYLDPLPSINGLFVDGDNLNALLSQDDPIQFTTYLQSSIAFELQQNPAVLILAPKGGLAIQTAIALSARKITVVEGNPLVVKAAGDIYHLPLVNLVTASGRSFLHSSNQLFDIILLPLTDSYHPVSSGAYSLGEDYRYTLESFKDMINNLEPNGLLVITRWLQESPSEWLRAFTLAVTALEEEGLNPGANLIALRGYNTGTLLIKSNPFDDNEIQQVQQFAREKAFDLVVMPTLTEAETNQYNILPEPIYYQTFHDFLTATNRQSFYQTYPYDITPPTDDHPFFSHFFKWSQIDQILNSLGTTWQPFGGAGYLVILIIFAVVLIFASALIILPAVLVKGRATKSHQKPILSYYAIIGMAFMLVEMPLIQCFILYLDQPAYALAAVLFSLLLFSGIGSSVGSRKLPLTKALILLIGLLTISSLVLPILIHLTLGFSLSERLMITIIMIAPIGFLMGIPFPSGLSWLEVVNKNDPASHQWLISYAWAVNGACSVIASILASLISLSFGFKTTLIAGTLCYLFVLIIVRKNDTDNQRLLVS